MSEVDVANVGTWVAFGLTVMVFCYLGKDLPFLHAIYRIAAYIFVGVSLGYGAVMAWHLVLWPRLIIPLAGGQWIFLVPLLLLVDKPQTKAFELQTRAHHEAAIPRQGRMARRGEESPEDEG